MDRGEVGDHVLGPVSGHDGNKLALTDAEGLEPCGCLVHHISVLRPGQDAPVVVLPMDSRLIPILVGVSIEEINKRLAFNNCIDLGSLC
jgi:hypothetical protein